MQNDIQNLKSKVEKETEMQILGANSSKTTGGGKTYKADNLGVVGRDDTYD